MDLDDRLARLAALAKQITQGKDILFESAEFDRPASEIPPTRMAYFTKSKTKWDNWIVEYEKVLAWLHKQNALPDEYRCQRCGQPVHVPWQSNETCVYCEGPNAGLFKQMQNNNGWVIINSTVLGESIVIVRDLSVAVTPQQRGLVRYSVAEVKLLEYGKSEQLKQLHLIKQTFGGTISQV